MKPLKQSPLKVKKSLTATKSLKSSRSLSASTGKGSKQKKPSVSKLKKEAIKWFNRSIKYRDSELIEGEWLFICITCPRRVLFRDRDGKFNRSAHAGHFQPCHKENTRFNDENVNGQCGSCNYNQGEQYKYARGLESKYGDGTADKLEKLAKVRKQWTVPELEEIIKDSKHIVDFYEKLG